MSTRVGRQLVAMLFLCVGSASAEEAARFNPEWSGSYVGATLGYFSGSMAVCTDAAAGYECDDLQFPTPAPRAQGATLGVTLGRDWQTGTIVYGVVGDLMFGNLDGSAGSNAFFLCGPGCAMEVLGLAMLRGRVGYTVNDALVHGSLGIAASRVSFGELGGPFSTETVINPVVGIGVDYRMSDQTTLGLEVLHLLERADPVLNPTFCLACGATDFSATSLQFSVKYRF